VKPCPCCGGRNILEFRSPLDSNGNALSIDNVFLTQIRKNRNENESESSVQENIQNQNSDLQNQNSEIPKDYNVL
jgi:hypothetical protein